MHLTPGQVVLTKMIPYPDGTLVQYVARPFLVVGISETHIETLVISSLQGKQHKALMRSNYVLKRYKPPLLRSSFVKLDSLQRTAIANLSDLRLASNGIKIDENELEIILEHIVY